jgi:PAS domain S-box-containing protein
VLGLLIGSLAVFAVLMALLLRDIVLRRRLTAELQYASGLVNSVKETMAQGLAVFDEELQLLQWNRRWLDLLDLPDTLAQPCASFAAILQPLTERGELAGQTPAEMLQILREGLRQHQSTRFSWQTNSGLWLEAQTQPTADHKLVITYTDITALKLAEQRLSEQAARLSAVLDNASDAIITINESGSIESFNGAAEKLFGYRSAEVLQRNVRMLMPEPYGSAHDHYLRRYLSSGVRHVIGSRRELEGLRRDGEVFPLEISINEMWLGNKRLFIGTLRDISERLAVERMKNEFISTVSHELRTPLTSIAGSLGLLAGGATGELPAKTARLIAIAHNNSERLVRLINDLLDMEKIESGKMDFRFAPLSLAALTEQAIDANRGYAETLGVELRGIAAAGDSIVFADADRLMQVLTNLISNAVKFSPRNGAVTLEIFDHGDAVRLSVHDDGAGIPDEFRQQIFGKVAQADASDSRQRGGTGLGLNIAKRIVERHGGHIGFDSDTRGGGTTFWINLQKWREHLPLPTVNAADAPRVLICEDDVEVAAVQASTLNDAGLAVDIAHSVRDARALLAANSYAAMTLDLLLPDGDGLNLLKNLREEPATNTLPVIVVSAKADERRRLENIGVLQVAGWLRKPVRPAELTAAVHSATSGPADHRLRVLHVEDDADVIGVVRLALQNVATVVAVKTLRAAKERLGRERFDAIVLDLSLPDGSGLELLELLEQGPAHNAPVVIFSAQDAGAAVAQQVQAALTKSRASIDELVATIKMHARQYRDEGQHGGKAS